MNMARRYLEGEKLSILDAEEVVKMQNLASSQPGTLDNREEGRLAKNRRYTH
jgi:hypothetical protein